jgi:3-phenylpropionate/cinnamic acid dioxygenase small subunit
VAQFLYHEARLMDENRYREWLALWEKEAVYWVPCNDDDIDPTRQVSIIYDDWGRIEQRVERLVSGSVLAQDPKPRMRRTVSNIEIEEGTSDEITTRSNFTLVLAKGSTQQLWAGRTIHKLRRSPQGFKIFYKKVMLVNADQEMPLLQFLV